MVERACTEIATTREVPLLGCVALCPQRVAQGPAQAKGHRIEVRLEVIAEPELRARCAEAVARPSLPPLTYEGSLPKESEVFFGFVGSLDRVESAWHGSSALEIEGRRARVRAAKVRAHGSKLAVDATPDGEICGDVMLEATLAFRDEGRALSLSDTRFDDAERARMTDAGIDPTRFLAVVTEASRVGMPFDPAVLRKMTTGYGATLSDEALDVRVNVRSVDPGMVHVRGETWIAWVRVRGEIVMRPRDELLRATP